MQFLFFRMVSLHEMGILKYLERKYFNTTDYCGDTTADSSTLSMSDMWPAFVPLAVGITLAGLVFVVEILIRLIEQKS